MTNRDTAKLVELLRVFINSPCRTKADAEVLEAKLAEFEKEISKPQRREHAVMINTLDKVDDFITYLDTGSGFGYEIEACGMTSSNPHALWAILSRPKED